MIKNIAFIVILLLNGCSLYQDDKVAHINGVRWSGCSSSCVLADYIDLSSRVTQQMINSAVLNPLRKQRATIRVELLNNNTTLNNNNLTAIYQNIQETLLNTNKLRLLHHTVSSYDYSLEIKLSKVAENTFKKHSISHQLELLLFNPKGKVISRWSDSLVSD